MKKLTFFLFLITLNQLLPAQDTNLPLWPEGIPCENKLETIVEERADIGRVISEVHEPEIEAFLPAASQRNGTSVIICPGGGYGILAWDWEGVKIAEWYNSFGVAAFVLKYRLPQSESEDCRDQVALMDAQRAMRLVRSRAADWQLNPEQIGIMGFSAGGHLAATLSTHFDYGDSTAILPLDRLSCRPDFTVLLYPVITMDPDYAHMGSRKNLIGASPSEEKVSFFSNEKQITSDTPTAIIIHASDDESVVPENSMLYYLGLQQHQIPASLHIFQEGGHGFSMAEGMGNTEKWPLLVKSWLADRGLLEKE